MWICSRTEGTELPDCPLSTSDRGIDLTVPLWQAERIVHSVKTFDHSLRASSGILPAPMKKKIAKMQKSSAEVAAPQKTISKVGSVMCCAQEPTFIDHSMV
jgi:hypothetical protein